MEIPSYRTKQNLINYYHAMLLDLISFLKPQSKHKSAFFNASFDKTIFRKHLLSHYFGLNYEF